MLLLNSKLMETKNDMSSSQKEHAQQTILYKNKKKRAIAEEKK